MRSTSSAGLFVALALSLSGCARVDVHSSQVRGLAYVRIDQVEAHHPLHAQLAQLEDAIAAIDLTAAAPHVPRSAGEIASATKQLDAQLRQAQDRANAILAQKQRSYAAREQEAMNAALAAAGVSRTDAGAGSAIRATSAQQLQAAEAQASHDLASYQQSVIAQDNSAVNAVARQLQIQADQKFRARAEQYQQTETDLSLRLAQGDSAQRLAIRTRLSNLALDDATHKQLQDQLAALDKKEADQVNALHARNAGALAAYRAQLSRETSAAIRTQAFNIQSQTTAKLVAKRNEVGAQLRSLAPAPLPQNLPAGTQAKLARIHAEFAANFQRDAQKTVAEYQATKADLDRQFAALHGQDVGATGAAAKELAQLQQRHDELAKQIDDQIMHEAERLAKDQGFTVVFANVEAAPGGYDMTNALIHDVESLHE